MKIKYDAQWTEDHEVAIAECLDLNDEQSEKLFAKHGTIVVPDTFKQKWARFISDLAVEEASEATPPVKDVSVAGSHAKLARDMASVIHDDTAINARARQTVLAGEEVKRGPLALCLLLELKYGAAKIASFPDHDAYGWERKVKDDDGNEQVIPASNNPAKWKVPGKNPKTGNAIETTYDFYQVFADDTSFGEEVIAAQEACNNAQAIYSDKGSTKTCQNFTTASGDVIPLSGMAGSVLRAEVSMWTKRRSALASQYRMALRLSKKLVAMSEYPKVGVQVAKLPDGTLGRSQYPITIYNKENIGEFKVFTPSNFLNLDIEKATENGGTYENLMATVGKGASESATPVVVEAIKSANTADEYVAELVSYLEKPKPSGEFAINKYLNEKDTDGNYKHDDLLLSIRSLGELCDSIVSKHEKRLSELDETDAAEQQ